MSGNGQVNSAQKRQIYDRARTTDFVGSLNLVTSTTGGGGFGNNSNLLKQQQQQLSPYPGDKSDNCLFEYGTAAGNS